MIFVDTWGWISLYNQREPSHDNVKIFYRKCRLSRTKIYTTDYVLDETLTLIFRRLPFELAKKSMNAINTAIRQEFLILEHKNQYELPFAISDLMLSTFVMHLGRSAASWET